MKPKYWKALLRRAENGSGPAAYEVAWRMNNGQGVPRDAQRADQWLEIAVERGAPYALRTRFEELIVSEPARAIPYGKRMVAQGPSNLARDFALQLVYGPTHDFDLDKARTKRGPDPRRGVAWLRELARQDDLHAIKYLAIILDRPAPLRRKTNEALEWAKLAAKLGDTTPLVNLGAAAHNGENGRRDYRRSVFCYRLAIRHADAAAWLNLGRSYMRGHGVERDERRGVRCFRMALRMGERDAELALAEALWAGEGVRRDRAEAWRLATRCARRGLEAAQVWRGAVLTEESGDTRAQRRGVRILERLVARGSSMAMNDLGCYLHELEPRAVNLPRAIELYNRSVALGNDGAMENLAHCFLSGHEGIHPRVPSAAKSLLQQASLLGNSDARTLLRRMAQGSAGRRA